MAQNRQAPRRGLPLPDEIARITLQQNSQTSASSKAGLAAKSRGLSPTGEASMRIPPQNPLSMHPPIHDRFVAALNAKAPASEVAKLDFTRMTVHELLLAEAQATSPASAKSGGPPSTRNSLQATHHGRSDEKMESMMGRASIRSDLTQ